MNIVGLTERNERVANWKEEVAWLKQKPSGFFSPHKHAHTEVAAYKLFDRA